VIYSANQRSLATQVAIPSDDRNTFPYLIKHRLIFKWCIINRNYIFQIFLPLCMLINFWIYTNFIRQVSF